jgi:hypothetical protein
MNKELWPLGRSRTLHEKDLRAIAPMALTAVTALAMAVACDSSVAATDNNPAPSAAARVERTGEAVICDEMPKLVINSMGTKSGYATKIDPAAGCETKAYRPTEYRQQIAAIAAGQSIRLVCADPESPGGQAQVEYDYYPRGGEHIRAVSDIGEHTFDVVARPKPC